MVTIPQSSGVYLIRCSANGKIYVGSAVNLRNRWQHHYNDLKGNRHQNRYLQNAWNKYGEGSFEFTVLEFVMPWSLLDREQYWIDKLRPYDHSIGFNIAQCSTAPSLGLKHSPEHIAKTVAKTRGLKRSEEFKERLRQVQRGKKATPEARQKMREAKLGTKASPETRAKMSASRLGNKCATGNKNAVGKRSAETCERVGKAKRKNWIVTDPNGVESSINGLPAFCREHGLNPGHMAQVALGHESQHKGWKCRHDD